MPDILEPDCGTLFASVFVSIAVWTWIAIQACALCTIPGLICVPGWYDRLEKAHDEKAKHWKREREADRGGGRLSKEDSGHKQRR